MIENQSKIQRGPAGWELDEDIDRGFQNAVRNNQIQLAMQYLQLLLARLERDFAAMKEELSSKDTPKQKAKAQKSDGES